MKHHCIKTEQKKRNMEYEIHTEHKELIHVITVLLPTPDISF
jgi:hypothetical protein